MGARLRVFLTRARKIEPCSTSQQQMYPRKSKTPAEIIRLNAQGWYVEKIPAHVNWTAQTVTEVLHKWENLGVEGLWERPRRGGESQMERRKLSVFGRMPQNRTPDIQQSSINRKIRTRTLD